VLPADNNVAEKLAAAGQRVGEAWAALEAASDAVMAAEDTLAVALAQLDHLTHGIRGSIDPQLLDDARQAVEGAT
jgi:hypothetical protein